MPVDGQVLAVGIHDPLISLSSQQMYQCIRSDQSRS